MPQPLEASLTRSPQQVSAADTLGAVRIASIYISLGALWILLSDRVLNRLVSDAELIERLQTFKGWFYVLVTGVMLYLLVRRSLLRQHRTLAVRQADRDLLASLIESFDEPVFAKDTAGRYIMVNRAACRGVGLPSEDILGKTADDLFDADYALEVSAVDSRVMASGRSESYERESPNHPSTKTLLINRSPIVDAFGRTIGVVSVAHDITERRRSEASLRASEQRWRTIVQIEPECVKVVAPSGELLEMNPAGLAMLDATSLEQVRQRSLISFIAPAHRSAFVNLHQRVMQGESGMLEFEVIGVRGRRRWLQTHAAPMRGPAGEVTALLGVTRDVTEQKAAEDALRANEQRFRALVENSFDVIALSDAQGKILYVSPSTERIRGFSPAELIGQNGLDHIHPEDRHRAAADLKALLNNPGWHLSREMRVLHKDGSWRWAEGSLNNMLDDPAVGAIVVNWRCITDRKRIQEQHDKVSAFREAIIRTAAEGICVCQPDAEFPFVRFTVWNQRMVELTGYTMEEINHSGWYQTLYPDPDVQQMARDRMDRMRIGDNLVAEEWEIRCKSGARRIVAISTSLVLGDNGGPAAVAMMQDVTERRLAEQSLRHSYEMERLLFRELDHRVRNNLASLMALIEISRSTATDAEAFAQSIGSRVRNMAGIHELLSRSHWRPIDLRDLIAAMTPKPIPGQLELVGEPVHVPTRQIGALCMVLHELMTNSAKYGALGAVGGCVRLTWEVATNNTAKSNIVVNWQEKGGPLVAEHPMRGTGTVLIEGLTKAELKGEATLCYPRDGASHTLSISLDQDLPESDSDLTTQGHPAI